MGKNQHALILVGKRGRQIFDKIANTPKASYERLKMETEEAKRQFIKERQSKNEKEDPVENKLN